MIHLICLRKKGKKKDFTLSSKKANAILDTLFILVVLFVVGFVWFFSDYVSQEINTDIQADADLSNLSKQTMLDNNNKVSTLFDNLFVMMLVLFWIGAIASSFYIDTNAIYFVFSVLLLITILIIGAYLSNAFGDTVSESDFSAQKSSFTKTIFIMDHLIEFIAAIAFSVMIALFAKSREG